MTHNGQEVSSAPAGTEKAVNSLQCCTTDRTSTLCSEGLRAQPTGLQGSHSQADMIHEKARSYPGGNRVEDPPATAKSVS